jgi:hypothetical protein
MMISGDGNFHVELGATDHMGWDGPPVSQSVSQSNTWKADWMGLKHTL